MLPMSKLNANNGGDKIPSRKADRYDRPVTDAERMRTVILMLMLLFATGTLPWTGYNNVDTSTSAPETRSPDERVNAGDLHDAAVSLAAALFAQYEARSDDDTSFSLRSVGADHVQLFKSVHIASEQTDPMAAPEHDYTFSVVVPGTLGAFDPKNTESVSINMTTQAGPDYSAAFSLYISKDEGPGKWVIQSSATAPSGTMQAYDEAPFPTTLDGIPVLPTPRAGDGVTLESLSYLRDLGLELLTQAEAIQSQQPPYPLG